MDAPVSERGFTSLDDVDPAPMAAYRDADGQHHEAPSGLTLRFSPYGDRADDLPPSAGTGVLDVFVCTNTTVDGAGLLLVDGVLVAAGDGRYQVELPPGEHRVEVQGADASSAEFTLAPGERVVFSSGHGVAVRSEIEFSTVLYRVEPGSEPVPRLAGEDAKTSTVGCLAALAGLVLLVGGAIAASAVGSAFFEILFGVVAVAGLAGLVGGCIAGFRTTGRLHKRAAASRIQPVYRARPARSVLGGAPVAFPSPFDLRDWARRRRELGVALVFDLFLYRAVKDPVVAYEGTGKGPALAAAGGLRLWIDGIAAPCDWSVWYYPLAQGRHSFRVEYEGPEGESAGHTFELDVRNPASPAVVHVPVRVFRIWDATAGRHLELPPQIAHRLARRPQQRISKYTNGCRSEDGWSPHRIWPS
ncbi:hypothetical protein [Kribbella shirazensis]|uniref:Uncharacterized protein n=1 Tax=Kribbella shirazensis TaxID=1105143 RepID=A0A7X5V932_9ACTN|nr:hypothetical protein [Kribbella shirazensis]NIK56880.1 hypothetical protein [Kribbella shirazensis]